MAMNPYQGANARNPYTEQTMLSDLQSAKHPTRLEPVQQPLTEKVSGALREALKALREINNAQTNTLSRIWAANVDGYAEPDAQVEPVAPADLIADQLSELNRLVHAIGNNHLNINDRL